LPDGLEQGVGALVVALDPVLKFGQLVRQVMVQGQRLAQAQT
jgi:hypothetical protein